MTSQNERLLGLLTFLRRAESLKHLTRIAWTSTGAQETVAAHSWRLCLLALVLGRHIDGVDLGKLLQLCIVHDLGEAINGDISAALQATLPDKSAQERADLLELTASLPADDRAMLVALWDEYEQATTLEARIAKGLDKLETILQHNQGAMPDDFDFGFNLAYGARYTAAHPLLQALRTILDAETAAHAEARATANDDAAPMNG